MSRIKRKVPETNRVLDNMKLEIADELGIHDYNKIDKGQLTSRENGTIGGNMVKRMIEYAETHMTD